jgi:acetyl esterase/lipase
MPPETWWPLVVVLAVAVVALPWTVARWRLRGADLSAFDQPSGERFGIDGPSDELRTVVASLGRVRDMLRGVPRRQRLAMLRRHLDDLFADRRFDVRIVPVDDGGVRGEWVVAPGADTSRRTLYVHGGAFVMGSPRSHRTLTSRLAELTGGAVFAVDYRLMPEHPRRAGIDDCRRAYRWMLDHGPDGPQPATAVFVGGDSAGGNLALSLLQWVRDEGLRAPDAAVALSPLTDATLASPSLRRNVGTDPMLGPLFGALARVPRTLLLWSSWLRTGLNPSDPIASPLRGDLSRLPPVLLQASEVEMLFDDSQRYANRAQAAGSPVRFQRWAHLIHVWQIFHPELPEARHALDEIGRFLNAAAPRGPGVGAAATPAASAAEQPAPAAAGRGEPAV